MTPPTVTHQDTPLSSCSVCHVQFVVLALPGSSPSEGDLNGLGVGRLWRRCLTLAWRYMCLSFSTAPSSSLIAGSDGGGDARCGAAAALMRLYAGVVVLVLVVCKGGCRSLMVSGCLFPLLPPAGDPSRPGCVQGEAAHSHGRRYENQHCCEVSS